MLWTLLAIGLAGLYWIYDGYSRCLQLACVVQTGWRWISLRGRRITRVPRAPAAAGRDLAHANVGPAEMASADPADLSQQSDLPSMAVLITAHNEARNIVRRIDNLLACDYPADRLQIVVAADGCTDDTCALVRQAMHQLPKGAPVLRLYESAGLGKSATQNGAMAEIESDVVIFTDADVVFDRQFLRSAGAQFLDPCVGAVAGHLLFAAPGADAVVSGQGFFWQYELKLRRLETRLGLLAVVAGSCFAVRRRLFIPMDASVGDDCIVPLDVVSQGFRVVQDECAVCYDQFEYESDVVLRKRIRMTLRNWQGTWMRPQLLNPLRSPGYAFALWSHKVLRWLSPVFLLTCTAAAVGLLVQRPEGRSLLACLPFVGLYLLAAAGWYRTHISWPLAGVCQRVPVAGTAFSFVLVNVAFLIGVMRAMSGYRIQSYRNFIPAESGEEAERRGPEAGCLTNRSTAA